jgi:endonuclease/exonuclease/phosphatase family metal-dependent hydrolase
VRLSVATFNLHCGVDGWGRPYDVAAALGSLDADVLVLTEAWVPEDGPGEVAELAGDLGYTVFYEPLARGRLAGPNPEADHRWMRRGNWRGSGHALYLDSERTLPRAARDSDRYAEAVAGSWGVAVLSRRPVAAYGTIALGRLPQDRAHRAAVVAELDPAGGLPACTIIGTHMSHLTFGSPVHFRSLARALRPLVGDRPGVLAGDMNLWGPAVTALLPGWHRTVRGRTWPAWRPHSQIDHILVTGEVTVRAARVFPPAGSDHRPIRADLDVGPAHPEGADPEADGEPGSPIRTER